MAENDEMKELGFRELQAYYKKHNVPHDTDPRHPMNFYDTDDDVKRAYRIKLGLQEAKELDAKKDTKGKLKALPIVKDEVVKKVFKQIKDEDIKKGTKVKAAKGGSMPKQMEMFAEGGLKQEGGTVDPVSGNDVPVGSTKEEVRDDIPAQLSEGEFVMPADVVRFHGLDKMMQLRDEAKMGLKKMEAMGQMGNSEEATLPDDVPFGMDDLDTEDEPVEMAEGGVVQAANGTFLNPSTGIGGYQQSQFGTYNPTSTTPTVPTQLPTTSYIAPTQQATPMAAQQPLPAFGSVIPAPEGKPDEIIEYENAEGNRLSIPFVNGQPVYPIPTGYTKVDKGIVEAPKAPTPVAPKSTTSRVPTETGSNDLSEDDQITSTLGGARTSIGGVDYAISYGLDGTVSIQSIDNFKATGKRNFTEVTPEVADLIKTQTFGQIATLGKAAGLGYTILAEIGKKFNIDVPGYKDISTKIKDGEDATTKLDNKNLSDVFDMGRASLDKDFKEKVGRARTGEASDKKSLEGIEGLSEKQMRDMQAQMQFGRGTERFSRKQAQEIGRAAERDRKAKEIAEEKAKQERIDAEERQRAFNRIQANREEQERAEQQGRVTGREAGMSMGDDGGSSSSPSSSGSTGFGDSTGAGQASYSTAVGGFIPKKKKAKKMKQGGLASRK